MENRRLFVALGLILSVWVSWTFIAARFQPAPMMGPPEARRSPAAEASPAPVAAATVGEGPTPEAAETEGAVGANQLRELHVRTPLYDVTISNRGAVVRRWALIRFRSVVPPPGEEAPPLELVSGDGEPSPYRPLAVLTGDRAQEERIAGSLFAVQGEDVTLSAAQTASLAFRWADGRGSRIEKKLEFRGDSYVVGVTASAVLPGARPLLALGPGIVDVVGHTRLGSYAGRAVVYQAGGVERKLTSGIALDKLNKAPGGWPPAAGSWLAAAEGAGQVSRFGQPTWAGLDDIYFAALLFREQGLREVVVTPVPEIGSDHMAKLTVAVPLLAVEERSSLYVGPKDTEILRSVSEDLVQAVEFGSTLGWLARALLAVLKVFHGWLGNYGLAIILFTVLIKILFLPLSIKQFHAMQKMAALQPKIKEIEDRYARAKNDPKQRLEANRQRNTDKMELFQREGVNPASGCLPLLVQLPFFWAFYALLGASIELRHAPFVLWIQDLSAKDPLYVTPVLMLVSMVILQMITPSTVDPAQRRMMYVMPVMFGFFFKDQASGLVLYWFTQNALSIVQQVFFNRWIQARERRQKEERRAAKVKKAT